MKSPIREGFRAAFRLPSLTFAEISWRWTVGAVAWILFIFSFVEYLDSVPVSRADVTLLGTRQPFLVGKAISHILRGSLDRAVFATLAAGLALILLWMLAAAIGRFAIVRALLEHFRGEVATGDSSDPQNRSSRLRSLLALNFLRVVVALAAILAFAGAAIVASFASPDAKPLPGLAFVLFLPLASAICLVWPALNWLLSLASVFVIRDADDTLAAISRAVTFFREHLGFVFAVTVWAGLAHLVAFSVASTVVSMFLAFLQFLPARLIIGAIILLTLAYFSVVDWLYIARLAGYVCIAEMPDLPVLTASTFDSPLSSPDAVIQEAIDRDEPILSDLPNLLPNT